MLLTGRFAHHWYQSVLALSGTVSSPQCMSEEFRRGVCNAGLDAESSDSSDSEQHRKRKKVIICCAGLSCFALVLIRLADFAANKHKSGIVICS